MKKISTLAKQVDSKAFALSFASGFVSQVGSFLQLQRSRHKTSALREIASVCKLRMPAPAFFSSFHKKNVTQARVDRGLNRFSFELHKPPQEMSSGQITPIFPLTGGQRGK